MSETPTPTQPDQYALVIEATNRDIAMRATLSPADQFTLITDRLFADLTRKATNPWFPLEPDRWLLIKLIWHRLRRFRRRFAAIMAQVRADTPPQPDSTPPQPAAAENTPASPPPPPPRPKLPTHHMGWVIHAVSWFVWRRHHEFKQMLDDPQTAAEVAEKPQLGSVLRPMCTMLAVKQPRWLRRPRRPRPSRAKIIPPAPDFLLNAPGAIIKPDGTIWMRFGASTKWTKPDLLWDSLEQAQKFDYPVKIWPR